MGPAIRVIDSLAAGTIADPLGEVFRQASLSELAKEQVIPGAVAFLLGAAHCDGAHPHLERRHPLPGLPVGLVAEGTGLGLVFEVEGAFRFYALTDLAEN